MRQRHVTSVGTSRAVERTTGHAPRGASQQALKLGASCSGRSGMAAPATGGRVWGKYRRRGWRLVYEYTGEGIGRQTRQEEGRLPRKQEGVKQGGRECLGI